MSGTFSDPPPQRPAASSRSLSGRSRALIITAVVVVAAFVLFATLSSLVTERLWYLSVGYAEVFSTRLWTQIGLFAVFFTLMALTVGGNMYLGFRFRPGAGAGAADQNLERYRSTVLPMRRWLLVGVSVLMGLFGGAAAAGNWRQYLMWRHGGSFGNTDPYFGRDIGFYVFDLPWFHFVVDYMMALAVVGVLTAAVVHYLFGGIRLSGPLLDRFSGAAQVQLSVLLGIFVLMKGVDYWLDRFDLLTGTGGLITGMTYTDQNAELPAQNILAGIAVICAVLFFLNIWRRTWLLPTVGLGLLVLSAVLLGMIWPALVQNFVVEPSENIKERPYIAKHIKATRQAYNIDDVKVQPYRGKTQPSEEELAQASGSLRGVRLVDPQVVQETFENQQQLRAYYSVNEVLDVDQYRIGGESRDLVLGVRQLNLAGIPQGSRNWATLHTVYTHGYGIIAAYGNQRPKGNGKQLVGETAWAETNLPPEGALSSMFPGGYQGRIYYGQTSPRYSIVGKEGPDAPDVELDVPGAGPNGGPSYNTYSGKGGVAIGSLVRQLLFAARFGDPNIVLSERVTENSKILYNRNPAEMVEKVAPWLTVDSDPYPVVVDGQIKWVIDAYTTTDEYPLSNKASFAEMTDDSLTDNPRFQRLPGDQINYIRNSVKAVVDAYDGTVTLYAWNTDDPILQAWREVFPGAIKPRSAIPKDLMQHLRYPEDLFKVQRFQLQKYHVTDPDVFYQGSAEWEVPEDPVDPGSTQPPYRLSVSMPGGPEGPVASLTSVFVPVDKQNVAAFLSVDAAAGRESYGTLRLLRISSAEPVPGPNLVANQIAADPEVKQALLPFTRGNRDRSIIYGNLLTYPVAGGLLYVQPIYTLRESGDGRYPVFRFVAVSFGEEVGFAPRLFDAVNDVLDEPVSFARGETGGGAAGPTPGTEQPEEQGQQAGPGTEQGGGDTGISGGDVPARVEELLRRANAKFEKAEQALQRGDTVAWARTIEEARELVRKAFRLAEDDQDSGSSGGRSAEGSTGSSGGGSASNGSGG